MADDLGRDLCAFDQGLSDDQPRLSMNQPYLIEFNRRSDIAGQAFDLNGLAVLDPILFPTCLNNRVHIFYPSKTGPLI